MQRKALLILIASLTLATLPVAFASSYKPIYPEFPAIRESKAYKKFSVRPLSDLSKILYLIDRFGEANVHIVYDNQSYAAPFATTVARWFLARNYKKQTPEAWVKEWCSNSILTNKLIYVKIPSGEFLVARDVLLAEIAAINEIIRENQVKQDSAQAVADVPLAKSAPEAGLAQTLPAGPKGKIS